MDAMTKTYAPVLPRYEVEQKVGDVLEDWAKMDKIEGKNPGGVQDQVEITDNERQAIKEASSHIVGFGLVKAARQAGVASLVVGGLALGSGLAVAIPAALGTAAAIGLYHLAKDIALISKVKDFARSHCEEDTLQMSRDITGPYTTYNPVPGWEERFAEYRSAAEPAFNRGWGKVDFQPKFMREAASPSVGMVDPAWEKRYRSYEAKPPGVPVAETPVFPVDPARVFFGGFMGAGLGAVAATVGAGTLGAVIAVGAVGFAATSALTYIAEKKGLL